MLRSLHIENFKSIRDSGPLPIRPITLLVGPNSAGKSAFLQSLLMLRQTADSTDRDVALLPSDGFVNLGPFPEFIYRHNKNLDLRIRARFDEPDFRSPPAERPPAEIDLDVSFFYDKQSTEIALRGTTVKSGDYRFRLSHVRGSRSRYQASFYKGKRRTRRSVIRQKFYGFYLYNVFREYAAYHRMSFRIEEALKQIYYLGPLRTAPERIYITSGQAPVDVGVQGERSVDVLWFWHRSTQQYRRSFETSVRRWLQLFGFAKDVRLKQIGSANYFRLLLVDPTTQVSSPIADVGFGISQALPVIIQTLFSPPRSDLVIEQPEIHLHPKAQAVLGDLFISRARARTFIIETHSEHLLARIRRRIAEGVLPARNVAIYYFEPSHRGTKVQPIRLNEDGQYVDFPEGFFEEDVREAFAHLSAIKNGPSRPSKPGARR